MKTSWQELLVQAMSDQGDTLQDIVACTLSDREMAKKFNSGYGGTEGAPFTLWTAKAVYFPVQYDGAEWVGSASRHPDGVPTQHQGGG